MIEDVKAQLLASCPDLPTPVALQLWSSLETRQRIAVAPSVSHDLAEVLAATETELDVLLGLLKESFIASKLIAATPRKPATEFVIRYICNPNDRLALVEEHLTTRSKRAAMWRVLGNGKSVVELSNCVTLSTLFATHAPVQLLVALEPFFSTPSSQRLADHQQVTSALLERLATARHDDVWGLALLVALRTPHQVLNPLIAALPATPHRSALMNWAAHFPWDPSPYITPDTEQIEQMEKLAHAVQRHWILAGADLTLVSLGDLDDLRLYSDCTPQEMFHAARLNDEQRQHLLLSFPPKAAREWLTANQDCNPSHAVKAFRAMIGTGTAEDECDAPLPINKAADVVVTLPRASQAAIFNNVGPWLVKDIFAMHPALKNDTELLMALPASLTFALGSPALNSIIAEALGNDPRRWSVFAAIVEANKDLSLSDALQTAINA